jgi:hypothetical protein
MIINQIQHAVNEEIDDRIWLLVSNKLANEATDEELNELSYLLDENTEVNHAIKQMYEWWDTSNKQNIATDSNLLFQNILKKLK